MVMRSLTLQSIGLKSIFGECPVRPLHPEQFFGPKTVRKHLLPGMTGIGHRMAYRALMLARWGYWLIYLFIRYLDNKPIIRKMKIEPELPPHQLALKEIERIKGDKIWRYSRSEEYYTELTDVLRTYMKERFGFNAMEMTSSKIIDKLLEINDKEAIRICVNCSRLLTW